MASINLNFYKKSYMLEFLENDEVEEVYTFSVPPENEQFDFGQRIIETKTFGGSVFENYGNDTIRITLSGSTGNGESKMVYRGLKKTPQYLTGENEIWHLQKQLEEWHDAASFDANAEKKIYLYDLSKMSALELAAMSPSKNWWRVFVKNFQIKRSVSKPIYFYYTLELLALTEEKESSGGLLSSVASVASEISETIDTVNNYVSTATDITSELSSAVETCQEAGETIKENLWGKENWNSESEWKESVLTITSGGDSVNRALNLNTNSSFFNSAKDCMDWADKLYDAVV